MELNSVRPIHWIESGQGPVVVFLPGWGQTCETWNDLLPFLKSYRCIALDLPGFGKSEMPPTPLSVQDYASIIHDFFLQQQMRPYAIVGHSFGGKVAIQYNLMFQQIPLFLISPSAIRPKRSLYTKLKIVCFHVVKRYHRFPLFAKMETLIMNRSGSIDYRRAQGVMRATLVQAVNTYFEQELKRITTPVTLLWGDHDQETPSWMGAKMELLIPQCRLIIKKGGHFLHLEERYHVLAELKHFLKEVSHSDYQVHSSDCDSSTSL